MAAICLAICCGIGLFCRAQISMEFSAPKNQAGAVKGLPYQAEKWVHQEKILPDGSVQVLEFQGEEARDSDGRIYEELQLSQIGSESARNPVAFFVVFDPTANTMLKWNSKSKVGTLIQLPDLAAVRASRQIPDANAKPAPTMPVKTEDLGHRIIDGLTVDGKRAITTIPAGRIGNIKPIQSTMEHWTSPELRVIVLDIRDNPQLGKRTMELKSLQRTEPDPALFHLPTGYVVQEKRFRCGRNQL